MIYGNSRCFPGDDKSPAQKLKTISRQDGDDKQRKCQLNKREIESIDVVPVDGDDFDNILLGIWVPPNSLTRATALKLLFPNIVAPIELPQFEDIPLHVAVAYDAFKAKDVFRLSEKYPGKVMNFGYFSSDIPGDSKLLAKTEDKFESRNFPVTYEEKIVIQLAKTDTECLQEFEELGPSYISRDAEIGENDCKYFFPPGYKVSQNKNSSSSKKKSKRKGKLEKGKQLDNVAEIDRSNVNPNDYQSKQNDGNAKAIEENDVIEDEVNNADEDSADEEDRDDDDEEDDTVEETDHTGNIIKDKSTSPMI